MNLEAFLYQVNAKNAVIILAIWLVGWLVFVMYICAYSHTIVFNLLLAITFALKSLSNEDMEVFIFIELWL